jgi:hypothetical protein
MFEKNILYFVIDLDCDSDTEPDSDTGSHDNKHRFAGQTKATLSSMIITG